MKKLLTTLLCISLLAATLSGCGSQNSNSDSRKDKLLYAGSSKNESQDITVKDDEEDNTALADEKLESSKAENSKNESSKTEPSRYGEATEKMEKWEKKCLGLLAPADDDMDFKWADDYVHSSVIRFTYMRDSGGYEATFGFAKPTKQQLWDRVDANKNIASKYKQFIKDYVSDWLTLWPESDFSILYYNLGTLQIEEMTEREIQWEAASLGSVACYVPRKNLICINKESNVLDKMSKDYIVFAHELTHAARTLRTKEFKGADGKNYEITSCFYEATEMGLYEDEVIDTWLVYQLQGLYTQSEYYIYQSSIYRQLLWGMEFDGADYMNHSINYFIEKLQKRLDELSDPNPAYYYVHLIDDQANIHYKDFMDICHDDFTDLYDLEVRNYIDLFIKSDMTYEQTEKAFENFWEDISFKLSSLKNPYVEATRENYYTYWEKHIAELGIAK